MLSLLLGFMPQLRHHIRRQSDRWLREHESSSDVVQSVCREILQDLESFEYRSDDGFRAWVLATARRKVIDRVRSLRADRRDVRREEQGSPMTAAKAPTPSEEAIAAELVENLAAALARLPPKDRGLVLARLAEVSIADLAKEAGITSNTMSVRMHRALARLSKLLPDAQS